MQATTPAVSVRKRETHGHWDENLEEFFYNCGVLWHIGDIGNIEITMV